MVALLVVGTIIMCLLVDGIVLSLRQKHTVGAEASNLVESPVLVFAQDGGEKIDEDKEKSKKDVSWEEVKEDMLSDKKKDEEA